MENLWSKIYEFLFSGITPDIANYIGLLLTIIGFGITWWQVIESRKASVKAMEGVQKVRKDIKRIDTVNDLSTAIAVIEEIQRHQRDDNWYLVTERYSGLRKTLVSIKVSYPELTIEQQTTIQDTVVTIRDYEKKIESATRNGINPKDVPRMNDLLSEKRDAIYQMLVELRNSIGG